MKKVVINILIILYFLVAVIVTYLLLSYNKYNIVETDNKYVLTLKEKNPDFKESDLLVVKKSNDYNKGDYVFCFFPKIFSLDNIKSFSNCISFSSKWGYLFIIIFPMLIAFVYEIYAIFKEIKKKK